MEKIPCSVPILTLNSEKFLGRCLESLRDFGDVFLLDGNSADGTVRIANEFGIPAYAQSETDEKNVPIRNFSAVRARAVSLCRHDWILLVDSDEFLAEGLADEIRVALEQNDERTIFYIQKKYSIGEKRIERAFNYPNYYPRLHNRTSGAQFKAGKLVHEQMQIPADVIKIYLSGWVLSEVPPTYRACVAKDAFQLNLMKQSTFARESFQNRMHSFRMSVVYFLRAVKILFRSLIISMHGGQGVSLPIGQVLRHVRVHLIMSYWRALQCFFGAKAAKRYATAGR